MKQIIIIILTLTLIGCEQETTKEASNQQLVQKETKIEEVMSTVSYQFDFDEVEYYSFEGLEIGQILDIHDKKKEDRTENEKLLLDFAFRYDITLSDTSKLDKLKEIGYKKKDFPKSKYQLLKEFFAKDHYLEETACEHVYRDILILKTKNQTTHFMKICFSCKDTQKATKNGSGRLYLSYYYYLEKLLKGEIEN